jgi:Family of unknown function (DUF6339)
MLLYPRLPAPTARILIGEMADADLDELRRRSATKHPACIYSPTGGNRVDEREIATLRTLLRDIADDCGYPREVNPTERVRFDQLTGAALHKDMRIVPADSAEPGVWAFLTCVVVPDIACWRFPRRTHERLDGGARNALRRLWWRVHLLDSPAQELTSLLGEDELVQIMERPQSVLGNPRVARPFARIHVSVCEELGITGRMRVLRDGAKRLLRLSALIALDALDDQSLEAVARTLLVEAGIALGETDGQISHLANLHLLIRGTDHEKAELSADDRPLRSAQRAAVPDVGAEDPEGDVDTAGGSALETIGAGDMWSIPLSRLRLAIVQAVQHGCPRLDALVDDVATRLGVDPRAIGEAGQRHIMTLARNAQRRGWIDVDDDTTELRFRAEPSGSAVEDGQLMHHSLAQIAAVVVGRSNGDDLAETADAVVETLGDAPPAGITAREIVADLRQELQAAISRGHD